MRIDDSTKPALLVCPPQDLVECIFPDSFIFPPYPPVSGPSSARKPSTLAGINTLFKNLCGKGLYSGKQWMRAPDLCDQHRPGNEQDFATFLNILVTEAVEFMKQEGIVPSKTRRWSVDSALSKLPGSSENRKTDIIAIDTSIINNVDWRAVDSIMELKSSAPTGEKIMGQLSERARMIFSFQDDRRFVILIRMRQDQFSYTACDRGGSIWSDFISIHSEPRIFLRLILGISLVERRLIGYDTSISGDGINRRVKLDLHHPMQGLRDLMLQLVLYTTGRVNSRGSTIRLLRVTDDRVANFYGRGGDGYKSLPGMKPGNKDFGIISKDTWDDPSNELSEGIVLQLLHAQGVRGVVWCLDEKPVVAPDAPPLPDVHKAEDFEPHALLDNTLYIRSRWGIRSLRVSESASWAERKQEVSTLPAVPSRPSKFQFEDPRGTIKGVTRSTVKADSSPSPSSSSGPSSAKGTKAKLTGKEKATSSPPPSSLPRHSSTTPPLASGRMPKAEYEEGEGPPFRLRSHIRSYMYPVGISICWFASLLELLCVFKDLLRTHHEACSSTAASGSRAKIRVLHRDLSLWNLMKVSQGRSDWPVDRQWLSDELNTCWNTLSEEVRSNIHRGLLVDWGFAAVEGVTSSNTIDSAPLVLTDEDVRVYPPTTWNDLLGPTNVVAHEDGLIRHCSSNNSGGGWDEYGVPPLWSRDEDGKLCEANTQVCPMLAKDGHVNAEVINDVLRSQRNQLSNATGTWPFISLDIMKAWMLGESMIIQPWHDLETLFVSFTAICIWFEEPYRAKELKGDSDFGWIFEARVESDMEALYRKWERFRVDFDRKIIRNLSAYFSHPAIITLLTELRDLCFPPSWGDDADRSPTGFRWPVGYQRVSHVGMLEAVEKAIITLLTDKSYDHSPVEKPKAWQEYHASIDADGIFVHPLGMDTAMPPVVVDGVHSPSSLTSKGIFYRVRPILPDTISTSATATTAGTRSSIATSQKVWREDQYGGLGKRPLATVTAASTKGLAAMFKKRKD